MSDAARWMPDGGVPDHEHITVDEETYWGLYYVFSEVRDRLRSGELKDPSLGYLVGDAERRLQQSREWNAIDPNHAAVVEAGAHSA